MLIFILVTLLFLVTIALSKTNHSVIRRRCYYCPYYLQNIKCKEWVIKSLFTDMCVPNNNIELSQLCDVSTRISKLTNLSDLFIKKITCVRSSNVDYGEYTHTIRSRVLAAMSSDASLTVNDQAFKKNTLVILTNYENVNITHFKLVVLFDLDVYEL